jgi:UDP-4-amino-4,6-dideoxy-N-acetyl-beta-L-altrosamine transaminase
MDERRSPAALDQQQQWKDWKDLMSMIPYGRQSISDADIQAVVDVLRSDFLTQGPVVPRFERGIASYCGAAYGVAANSATSALHIACLALGVSPGDRVWTSPITFVASANCALYCGAEVDFVDIDPLTYNLCPQQLRSKLERARAANRLPKVVIPVHFSGLPCDMAAIHALSLEFGFRILEDASHAIGASYQQHKVGSCQFSDITVFSFHPVKIITTAEGGLATTQSAELAQSMQEFRSHGITRETARLHQADSGPWYYEQQQLGFNYRMTEMQAALGVSQLDSLDDWIDRRHQLADTYDQALSAMPLVLPRRDAQARSGLHLYVVQVDQRLTTQDRRQVFDALRGMGIGVNVHYIPVHLQPYYTALGFQPGQFPAAEAYYRQCISLPMYVGLTDAMQQTVVGALQKILL